MHIPLAVAITGFPIQSGAPFMNTCADAKNRHEYPSPVCRKSHCLQFSAVITEGIDVTPSIPIVPSPSVPKAITVSPFQFMITDVGNVT